MVYSRRELNPQGSGAKLLPAETRFEDSSCTSLLATIPMFMEWNPRSGDGRQGGSRRSLLRVSRLRICLSKSSRSFEQGKPETLYAISLPAVISSAIGIVKWNVLPLFSSDSTQILPPHDSTIDFANGNPSPVPFWENTLALSER
jgi:hypothetical protein